MGLNRIKDAREVWSPPVSLTVRNFAFWVCNVLPGLRRPIPNWVANDFLIPLHTWLIVAADPINVPPAGAAYLDSDLIPPGDRQRATAQEAAENQN